MRGWDNMALAFGGHLEAATVKRRRPYRGAIEMFHSRIGTEAWVSTCGHFYTIQSVK
jgi:hypothetical protein